MKLSTPVALVIGLVALAQSASALEFSMVSGLYRSEKDKQDGESTGGKSTIDLGARVSAPIDQHLYWLGEGQLTLRSYDAGKGGKAPDDTTSLSAGGGVRYYFSRFSEFSVPYVQATAHYRNEKDGSSTLVSSTTKEINGLYYGAAAGIRFGLDKDFFLDLETPLFDSPLFATETSETTTFATGTKTKTTQSHTDLYINTTGALSSVAVAFGMKI